MPTTAQALSGTGRADWRDLNRIDAGFNRENVLRLDIDSDITGYKGDDPRLKMFFKQIEDLHAPGRPASTQPLDPHQSSSSLLDTRAFSSSARDAFDLHGSNGHTLSFIRHFRCRSFRTIT
jgi:hypothetical protein